MATRSLFWTACAFGIASAIKLQATTSIRASANPIRKVVNMLEAIQKKVAAEGEQEEEMHKKYLCYCKTSGADLETSIASASAKAPEVSSAITEGEAKKAQLDQDLTSHKADREAAKTSMAEATALREKEASAYAAKKAEYGSNIAAIEKAVAALEKGMSGAFLQTAIAKTLRSIAQSSDALMDADRQELMAFLAAGQGSQYAPASGEITGILKQIGDTMAKGLADETAAEEAAITSYEEMMSAKKEEVGALTASIETKTVQTGEVAVSIVEMKDDLADTEAAMAEDKQFLADLSKNCETKTAEWDVVVKTRTEEQAALAEAIKILNDDEALELFKKTLPSSAASFVQVKVSTATVRSQALTMIREAQHSSKSARPELDLIALALHGKTSEFEKVIAMIDAMVSELAKEQTSDDSKKAYCAAEFDATDDQKKGLERAVSDTEAAIATAEESVSTLSSEIDSLLASIKDLDKSVAEATELRKEENAAFTELMASDSKAKDLLSFVKNKLNKFYNPSLYLPPPKQELSAEDQIVVNFGGSAPPTPAPGGIAGTGVFAQVNAHTQSKVAPPPPPETFGAYSKKTEETTGVIAMMDMLIKDLDKEMTTAETVEKDSQADYEVMMKDSAAKRAADSKLISEKESAKAETAAELEKHKETKGATMKELEGTIETIKALHSECDWLVEMYSVRKEARAGEVESLKKAKAVLSGSDFSLIQSRTQSLRGSSKSA